MTAVEDDIQEIATSIWETLFSAPLERTDSAHDVPEPVVTGCVTIEGAWNGAVMFRCEQALAQVLAGELFQSPSPTADEVRDTVGELTNMLAGNVKALLPDPSRISLPTVAFGGDYELRVLGTATIEQVGFRCGDRTLRVSLHRGGPVEAT
ncbi:MAG: chemotaxis protein CheX [Mycobacteriales bacterium]